MDTKKAKSTLEKAPIIYIEWVDAVADVEWQCQGPKSIIVGAGGWSG